MHLNEDFQLNFDVCGKGEALLCLHGNRDSSAVYKNLAEEAKQYFQVICPDLRGHGHSAYGGEAFTIDNMVEDIIKLLHKLSIERISIVGHSLGSTLAMLLAVRIPERVKMLVLISAAASFEPSFKRPLAEEAITPEIVQETNKAAEGYFFMEKHPAVKEFILQGWSSMSPRMHQMLIKVKHPDMNPLLKRIQQPVLLICGQEDKLTPIQKSLELNQRLSDSRLLIIPDTGHFVFLEEQDKVLEAIISFLKERP